MDTTHRNKQPLKLLRRHKKKEYQEIMFFDWKIQIEKVQLTRDLKDDTIINQVIQLPCKNDQRFCYPTTRTPAKIIWFLDDTCTTFQVAKIHARMIKFHQKNFFESIPYEKKIPTKSDNTIIILEIFIT